MPYVLINKKKEVSDHCYGVSLLPFLRVVFFLSFAKTRSLTIIFFICQPKSIMHFLKFG